MHVMSVSVSACVYFITTLHRYMVTVKLSYIFIYYIHSGRFNSANNYALRVRQLRDRNNGSNEGFLQIFISSLNRPRLYIEIMTMCRLNLVDLPFGHNRLCFLHKLYYFIRI